MITVQLAFPNGTRRPILLAGVPRVGDDIRLTTDGDADPSLIVTHVLWFETKNGEPSVTVVVRPRDNGGQR